MTKKLNKRGFTIVELVVVIVVIAILAAVLIPTISNLITKANRSADIQAVYNMNTALTIESTGKNYTSLQDALNALKSAGIDGDHYKALADGYKFVWDSDLNRILYIDKYNNVAYPDEYKDLTFAARKSYWIELNGRRAGDDSWQNNGVGYTDSEYPIGDTKVTLKEGVSYTKYTLTSADQLASFANKVAEDDAHGASMIIELEKDATYDMSGAWDGIEDFAGIFNGNGATITNFSITDTNKNIRTVPSWTNDSYQPYAFISYFQGQYFGNVTLTVNIDASSDVNSQNHTVAGALGYVSAMENGSQVLIENVTVNGVIRAPFRAAGIVGFVGGYGNNGRMNGTVIISNCTNNAKVESYLCLSSYNTAAGIVSTTNQLTETGRLVITDCINSGEIIGSDVAGILANCFGAYATDRTDNKPCGVVEITKCSNSGKITAMHKCDTSSVTNIASADLANVNCAYAGQIYAPYNSEQKRVYVYENSEDSKGTLTATTIDNCVGGQKPESDKKADRKTDGTDGTNTNDFLVKGKEFYNTSAPTSTSGN